MGYKAKHHINLDGKEYEPGAWLPAERIDAVHPEAYEESEGGLEKKPLAEHTIKELAAIANELKIEIPPKTGKSDLVKLIESKLLELEIAALADTGGGAITQKALADTGGGSATQE